MLAQRISRSASLYGSALFGHPAYLANHKATSSTLAQSQEGIHELIINSRKTGYLSILFRINLTRFLLNKAPAWTHPAIRWPPCCLRPLRPAQSGWKKPETSGQESHSLKGHTQLWTDGTHPAEFCPAIDVIYGHEPVPA